MAEQEKKAQPGKLDWQEGELYALDDPNQKASFDQQKRDADAFLAARRQQKMQEEQTSSVQDDGEGVE